MKPLLSRHPRDLSKSPLNRGCPLNRVCYKGKYHKDTNIGTRPSVHLIKGFRLIGVPLNRGLTVEKSKGTGLLTSLAAEKLKVNVGRIFWDVNSQ